MLKLSRFLCAILISTNLCASDYLNFDNFKNNELVSWSSKEGQKRFDKSKFKGDFIRLAPNFQPQINPLYCGIASSVIVLNTIYDYDRPNQPELSTKFPEEIGNKMINFNLYSQITLLDEETNTIKHQDIIEFKQQGLNGNYDPGLSLGDLALLLQSFNLEVDVNYVDVKSDEKSRERFRDKIKAILADENKFLIANFRGKSYGATTGGHISPIAAYDHKSDSILLLDVAAHKNPWYWVSLDLLYHAMHTKDGDNYRGFLVVSE